MRINTESMEFIVQGATKQDCEKKILKTMENFGFDEGTVVNFRVTYEGLGERWNEDQRKNEMWWQAKVTAYPRPALGA